MRRRRILILIVLFVVVVVGVIGAIYFTQEKTINMTDVTMKVPFSFSEVENTTAIYSYYHDDIRDLKIQAIDLTEGVISDNNAPYTGISDDINERTGLENKTTTNFTYRDHVYYNDTESNTYYYVEVDPFRLRMFIMSCDSLETLDEIIQSMNKEAVPNVYENMTTGNVNYYNLFN